MKKFVLILSIALILLLSACGNASDKDNHLQDLDYMLYALENNFALFDVAYWARDVDISAIVESVREDILNNPRMRVDEFYDSLFHHFYPLWGIGHFSLVSPCRHKELLSQSGAGFSRSTWARITSPHVLAFYEPRHPDEAIDRFVNIPVVTTEIVEEGRIAYLSVPSFMIASPLAESEQIRNFFRDIHGYEHLIIDLRGNRGGFPKFFHDFVMSPLLSEPLTVQAYAFFIADGIYAEEYTDPSYRFHWTAMDLIPAHHDLRSISEILDANALPQFNHADAERLDYGFPLHTTVEPRRHLLFRRQPAFDGKIWLLTDPHMFSAAQLAAWISKESGFATLVGEVTGGVFGGPRSFVALPNSGILFELDVFYVTDHHGRPLEAGTIPHYFNRDGMDALETALALIEEGSD